MSTAIRSELSGKNRYWIDRHRYYELKNFCLQYDNWKKARAALDGLSKQAPADEILVRTAEVSDPTIRCVLSKVYYSEKIGMVEQAAKDADEELASYILTGVTKGVPYTYLRTRLNIPCGRHVYYEAYRRFFWLLSKARG